MYILASSQHLGWPALGLLKLVLLMEWAGQLGCPLDGLGGESVPIIQNCIIGSS